MVSLYDNVKSYSEILIELGRENPNIFAVNSDMGTLADFGREFPNRFVEVGIAEQNLIGVAAGLAIRGKIPFVYAMAPFVTMRSYEQIRTDLAYGEKNVKIVSTCTGLSGGPWGTTHHSIEDITLMRVIPGMTVILPADSLETERAIRAAAEHIGLVYIRLGSGEPVYEEDYTFEIGKAVTLREGNDVTIAATGSMVIKALKAHDDLIQQGIKARVLNVHTIKPLDAEAILQAAEETGSIVTAEEHSVVGGLGGAVAEVLAESGVGRLKRVGIQDTFCTTIGSYEELCEIYGLTTKSIVEAVRTFVS